MAKIDITPRKLVLKSRSTTLQGQCQSHIATEDAVVEQKADRVRAFPRSTTSRSSETDGLGRSAI
jgi:hypothetical protein